jgi:hypothetical protein
MLALGFQVEAVEMGIFPSGGPTPVCMLLLKLGQRQGSDWVHEALFIHVTGKHSRGEEFRPTSQNLCSSGKESANGGIYSGMTANYNPYVARSVLP